MMKTEKILNWIVVLLAFVVAVIPFVMPGNTIELKVMHLTLSVLMLANLIKSKTIRLIILIICIPILLLTNFISTKSFLALSDYSALA